jgi:hypothetical protein
MVWESYHFGGEDACRVDLLDTNSVVVNTITFTDIASGAWFATPNMGPKMEQHHLPDYELRKLIDGRRQPIKGGFYYEAKLRFAALDLTNAGYVVSAINHCMKAGNYNVEFYPFSDNTDIHFTAFLTGEVTDFDEWERPLTIGHSATIEIYGLDPQEELYFDAPEGIICLDKTLGYGATETVNSQCASKGIVYTAPEMEDDLGYTLNKSKAIV